MVKAIEKAIQTSELGINPTNDGSAIRLVFPELTEERRKELVKDVKKKGEGAKVAIRNIRRDGNDALKKLKGSEVSEDEIKDMEEELQKVTDKFVKKSRRGSGGQIQRSNDGLMRMGTGPKYTGACPPIHGRRSAK